MIVLIDETKVNLEKYEEGKNGPMIQIIICQSWWAWACMAANKTGSLVFMNDAIVAISSWMNYKVYRAMLSGQIH